MDTRMIGHAQRRRVAAPSDVYEDIEPRDGEGLRSGVIIPHNIGTDYGVIERYFEHKTHDKDGPCSCDYGG